MTTTVNFRPKVKPSEVQFATLELGSGFVFEKDPYIRTNTLLTPDKNAFNLNTLRPVSLPTGALVEEVDLEILVSRK